MFDVFYGAALLLKEEEVDRFAYLYGKETGKGKEVVMEDIGYGEELTTPFGPFTISSIDECSQGIEFTRWCDGEKQYFGSCYAVMAEKQLPGQNMFAKAPYESMEELVEEYRERIGKYLPEDFDYEERIGFLVYAM